MKKIIFILLIGCISLWAKDYKADLNQYYNEDTYDGDTITMTVELGFNTSVRERFRLYGINAPEMRGSEKPMGIITRDWLRVQLIDAYNTDTPVYMRTIGDDRKGKYGRYLAEIIVGDRNLNQEMIDKKLAVEYMRD